MGQYFLFVRPFRHVVHFVVECVLSSYAHASSKLILEVYVDHIVRSDKYVGGMEESVDSLLSKQSLSSSHCGTP